MINPWCNDIRNEEKTNKLAVFLVERELFERITGEE